MTSKVPMSLYNLNKPKYQLVIKKNINKKKECLNTKMKGPLLF